MGKAKVGAMDEIKVRQQIIDKLGESNNILVAVNAHPTVDELSAALGLTLLLNKLDKHATAVFSGDVPTAVGFLEPERTFESTVDSLRDFIIALDKEKADHLRYKLDGDLVKIFITPYRATISQSDLEFSQGDYNVQFVVTIGVRSEDDLDPALKGHGRILRESPVAALHIDAPGTLGNIVWTDPQASSYSELAASLAQGFDNTDDEQPLLDKHIATAFLTGIVAATERFSNEKTTSRVMTLAAQLMSAGGDQQLIAAKLAEAKQLAAGPMPTKPANKKPAQANNKDKSLVISHNAEAGKKKLSQTDADEAELAQQLAKNNPQPEPAPAPRRSSGRNSSAEPWRQPIETPLSEPSLGGTLNATTKQAADDKRRERENGRNKTILSHKGGRYLDSDDTPGSQAPLNAATAALDHEPTVPNVNDMPRVPMAHNDDILPPPTGKETLADLDAKHRAAPADDAEGPALPPLPPMPDFSSLPPLPPGVPPLPGPDADNPMAQLDAALQSEAKAKKDQANPSQFHVPEK